MGSLEQEILSDFRHQQDLALQYEANLLDNQPVLRSSISGIDSPSREAVEKTIATVQTFALNYTGPKVIEYCSPTIKPPLNTPPLLMSFQSAVMNAVIADIMLSFASRLSEETLTLTAGALARASRVNFKILGAMAGSAALAALDFSKIERGTGRHIETIQTSYSGKVASALRDILHESEITDETVKPLEALISTKVTSLPQNRVSAEGMFTLLTTLLAVVISYDTHRHYSVKNNQLGVSHLQPLNYIVRGVLENTRRLIPQKDDNTYYRVMRQVDVSARPRPRTYHLGVLVPDQTVRLVDRNHKWISVEYFDQLHGVARCGWAPKKYFQQLTATGVQPAREIPPQVDEVLLSDEQRKAITEDWEETNKRRIDLIYKNAENKLSSEEQAELELLQQLADQRIRMVAPLPLAALESVLEKLERRT